MLSVPAINRSILVLSSTQKITVMIVRMAAILTACMNHDATGKARAENGAMRCEPPGLVAASEAAAASAA
ncbi:hypothetical protein GCM10010924_03080 [Rhizobium wenxiniae]|nr:hypothetical protein GCM10010924_03080 [Rhizobium wenxiniae]